MDDLLPPDFVTANNGCRRLYLHGQTLVLGRPRTEIALHHLLFFFLSIHIYHEEFCYYGSEEVSLSPHRDWLVVCGTPPSQQHHLAAPGHPETVSQLSLAQDRETLSFS